MEHEELKPYPFFLSAWIIAALITAVYGIMRLGSIAEPYTLVMMTFGSLIWLRFTSTESRRLLTFLMIASLGLAAHHPIGLVIGALMLLFAFLSVTELAGLQKKAGIKRWPTMLFLLLLPLLILPTRLFPAWTLPGLGVMYLFIALMLWMLPIALAMQASLEDDR